MQSSDISKSHGLQPEVHDGDLGEFQELYKLKLSELLIEHKPVGHGHKQLLAESPYKVISVRLLTTTHKIYNLNINGTHNLKTFIYTNVFIYTFPTDIWNG